MGEQRPWAGPSVSTASHELTRVGWYCPGGHPGVELEGVVDLPRTVGPSIRLEDPCDHGVPVYALLSPEQAAAAAAAGHGRR